MNINGNENTFLFSLCRWLDNFMEKHTSLFLSLSVSLSLSLSFSRGGGGGHGSSVSRACGFWSEGRGFDPCSWRRLPTGWVSVSIMWPAETEVMVSWFCSVWYQIKLSDIDLGTCTQYSPVADVDVKKRSKQSLSLSSLLSLSLSLSLSLYLSNNLSLCLPLFLKSCTFFLFLKNL